MNVQVIKTKAETALQTRLSERAGSLPGGAAAAKLREKAAADFEALGLPHRRIEEWKYSDLRTLLKDASGAAKADKAKASLESFERSPLAAVSKAAYIFVDGALVISPASAPNGATVTSFADALSSNAALLETNLPEIVDAGAKSIVALNTALVASGALIDIADGAEIAEPIHLVFISSGLSAMRTIIRVGKGATANVIEQHITAEGSDAQANALSLVTLAEAATLEHSNIANLAKGGVTLGNSIVTVGAKATYKPFHAAFGEGLGRQQLSISLAGEYGTFDLGVAVLLSGHGHSDTTLVVDHKVPHCTSRELVKCVLDDTSRGIFQGKVIVRPHAQKTDGKQMAQALMLSSDAEFDSKPELEIYADDVVCGHGSTSAELDEDLLFYLRSRGVPLKDARAMLVESFIGEAIDKIGHDGLREAVMTMARAWLTAAA